MKDPQEYRDLVKKLRGETECYPDECEYCSAEGKCRCQRLGQACDAIEELVPYLEGYIDGRKQLAEMIASFCGPFEVKPPAALLEP